MSDNETSIGESREFIKAQLDAMRSLKRPLRSDEWELYLDLIKRLGVERH